MDDSDRGVAHLFGIVGGVLIGIGGIFAVAVGIADAVLGRPIGVEIAALSEAILLFVVGGLVLLFSHFASGSWRERPLTSGILLVVLAVLGWGFLGLGSNLLALVGGLFALLAGVLYLIEPARRAALTANAAV
jgi:hypothetical protein